MEEVEDVDAPRPQGKTLDDYPILMTQEEFATYAKTKKREPPDKGKSST
jgi:hypothetical protein